MFVRIDEKLQLIQAKEKWCTWFLAFNREACLVLGLPSVKHICRLCFFLPETVFLGPVDCNYWWRKQPRLKTQSLRWMVQMQQKTWTQRDAEGDSVQRGNCFQWRLPHLHQYDWREATQVRPSVSTEIGVAKSVPRYLSSFLSMGISDLGHLTTLRSTKGTDELI